MTVSKFPYQLVTFLDRVPLIGEPVYGGENGWYAQVAIKRRFKLTSGNESDLVEQLENYFQNLRPFTIHTGELEKLDNMPVKTIDIKNDERLLSLHNDILQYLGQKIESKYPNREGLNYLPHITAEYGGIMQINSKDYANKSFDINSACLLKDADYGDSTAHHYFNLQYL